MTLFVQPDNDFPILDEFGPLWTISRQTKHNRPVLFLQTPEPLRMIGVVLAGLCQHAGFSTCTCGKVDHRWTPRCDCRSALKVVIDRRGIGAALYLFGRGFWFDVRIVRSRWSWARKHFHGGWV